MEEQGEREGEREEERNGGGENILPQLASSNTAHSFS